MRTPFPFGKPVTGSDLIGRDKEIKNISQMLGSSQSVILISPRRHGKTSIILDVLAKLEKEGLFTIYLDIFTITSKTRLAEKYVAETIKNSTGPIDKLIEKIRTNLAEALGNVKIKAAIDKFELLLDFAKKDRDDYSLLEKALKFPEEYAAKRKKKMIIALDEFSEIAHIGGPETRKLMRSIFQHQKNVTYIFAGSQESLMKKYFNHAEEAFFKFGMPIIIGPINHPEFKKYIISNFRKFKLKLKDDLATRILEITNGHPFYTQQICQMIYFDVKGEEREITRHDLIHGYERVMMFERSRFEEVLRELNTRKHHVRVLEIIAKSGNPYAISNVKSSYVSRILNNLEDMGHLRRADKGHYIFTDMFFKEFIQGIMD